MQISEFKAKGYPVEKDRDKHIRNFDYLDQLATDFGIDLSTWDSALFMGDGKTVPSKRDTARAFTEVRKSLLGEAQKMPSAKALDKAHAEAMDAIGKRGVFGPADRERMIALHSDACRLSVQVNKTVAEYAELRLRAGYRPRTDFANQIRGAMGDYGYLWHRLEKEKPQPVLWLISPEMHLQEVRREAGVDTRVNLGTFKIGVNLVTFSVFVGKHSGNTEVMGVHDQKTFHPHVSGAGWGTVCWGNASDQYRNYAANHDLFGLLAVLVGVLGSYGGAPYARLTEFADAIQKERDEKCRAELIASGKPVPENMGRPETAEPEIRPREARPRIGNATLRWVADPTIPANTMYQIAAPPEGAALGPDVEAPPANLRMEDLQRALRAANAAIDRHEVGRGEPHVEDPDDDLFLE